MHQPYDLAPLNTEPTTQLCPLMRAVVRLNWCKVRRIIKRLTAVKGRAELHTPLPLVVDVRDKFNNTPLHLARTPALVRELVSAGADALLADRDGRLPIHVYTQWLRVDLVIALKQHGRVSLDVRTVGRQESALHLARTHGMVLALLDLGASASVKSAEGLYPLDVALQRTPIDLDLMRVLLNAGGYWAREPLVAHRYSLSSVETKWLIQHGADVRARNEHCQALHWHFLEQRYQRRSLVVLLRAGADPNALDAAGRSPLHHCYHESRDPGQMRQIRALLRAAGARNASCDVITELELRAARETIGWMCKIP